MQAVIFAAGKGTRLGELTRDIPKPMLKVLDRPILEHTLEALPREIDEIILVVGYKQEVIKNHFGNSWRGRPLIYAEMKELQGTGGALHAARPLLKDRFLVIFGDDIRRKEDLEEALKMPLGFGIYHGVPNHSNYGDIVIDEKGNVKGIESRTKEQITKGINVCTGIFVLDERIFSYPLERIANGEFGLPQTIFKMAKDIPVPAIENKFWIPITYPEDLEKANNLLSAK